MTDEQRKAARKALAASLREKLHLSTGYASDLANRKRSPSLELAVKIERELGIAVAQWTLPSDQDIDFKAAA